MPSDIDVYSKSSPVVRPANLVHGLPSFSPSDHLVKVVHLFSGVYLCASILTHSVFFVTLMAACRRWEFFTTLDFEWEVFTGRRPWKWSFAVYLTSRLLALVAIMCNFIGFNLATKFDCNVSGRSGILPFGTDERNLTQAWFRCILAASWFSVAIASFLLALRGQVIHGRAFPRGGCRLTLHQNLESPFGDETNTSQQLPYQSGRQTLSVLSGVRLIASYSLDLISRCWFMQVLQR